MPDHPLINLRPRVRAELKRKRAERGDHATCPACEMTVLVDPRVAPGRLTEHHPVPGRPLCPASGWWRCYECMDGDTVSDCTFCGHAGWSPPAGAGASIQSDAGLRINRGGPQRPEEIPDPTPSSPGQDGGA